MDNNDFFFKSAKIEKFVIDGREIELPIRYYRDNALIGVFIAPTKQIINVLPTKRFKPIEILPSMALISLIGLHHYNTSIGPFSELDVGIPVFFDSKLSLPFFSALRYNKHTNFGIFMFRLFVSDEKALTAGIKVWNYPKVIADIKFEETDYRYIMKITKNNSLILNFMVQKRLRINKEHLSTFYVYSIKNKEILKSPVNWRGFRYLSRKPHFASFELGDQAYARELKNLSMKNFCVEGSFYSDLQYILNPPAEVYSLIKNK